MTFDVFRGFFIVDLHGFSNMFHKILFLHPIVSTWIPPPKKFILLFVLILTRNDQFLKKLINSWKAYMTLLAKCTVAFWTRCYLWLVMYKYFRWGTLYIQYRLDLGLPDFVFTVAFRICLEFPHAGAAKKRKAKEEKDNKLHIGLHYHYLSFKKKEMP